MTIIITSFSARSLQTLQKWHNTLIHSPFGAYFLFVAQINGVLGSMNELSQASTRSSTAHISNNQ
jgi:hypothetical protein